MTPSAQKKRQGLSIPPPANEHKAWEHAHSPIGNLNKEGGARDALIQHQTQRQKGNQTAEENACSQFPSGRRGGACISYTKELTLDARSPEEWEAMTLSEEYTVAALIKARQALDPCCHYRYCGYQLQETMICLYASLDALIRRTQLTGKEREIISWYMKGCAAEEISDQTGVTRQAVSKMLHNAVRKLVNQNAADWLDYVSDHYVMSAAALPYAMSFHRAA